ncbi:Htur_1727 family rSAM-partnered candidate RiPP [Halobaculum marinum]|uniref:Htur_1727 family rSAM-partnered candidate RiPP n=1 Tax=Halobaculum marinum TaxID=3031996 RepID=A0ABD5X193_9EURY|nr:Htur_1727 family rSAM-partnered candidate RiPP [Halobaculum sp. DT55]
MSDTAARTRVDDARADDTPEWEVFLRESPREPLRHAGSVTAPTVEVGHEQASTLFPDAGTLWLCRSDNVARFADRDLGAAYADTDADTGTDDVAASAGGEEA